MVFLSGWWLTARSVADKAGPCRPLGSTFRGKDDSKNGQDRQGPYQQLKHSREHGWVQHQKRDPRYKSRSLVTGVVQQTRSYCQKVFGKKATRRVSPARER